MRVLITRPSCSNAWLLPELFSCEAKLGREKQNWEQAGAREAGVAAAACWPRGDVAGGVCAELPRAAGSPPGWAGRLRGSLQLSHSPGCVISSGACPLPASCPKGSLPEPRGVPRGREAALLPRAFGFPLCHSASPCGPVSLTLCASVTAAPPSAADAGPSAGAEDAAAAPQRGRL